MHKNVSVIAAAVILLAWLPYVALQSYWIYLCQTVPGVEYGEISGPILYFLPRLLLLAVVCSLLIASAWGILHIRAK